MEVKQYSTNLQNPSNLHDIFSSRYQNTSSLIKVSDKEQPKDSLDMQKHSKEIQDEFLPSKEYSKILEIKQKLSGGFEDIESFKSMAKALKDENIINNNDLIALDFLANQSPKLSFDVFNKIIQNDNLSKEMKGLITELVGKLEMIDYLSNKALVS